VPRVTRLCVHRVARVLFVVSGWSCFRLCRFLSLLLCLNCNVDHVVAQGFSRIQPGFGMVKENPLQHQQKRDGDHTSCVGKNTHRFWIDFGCRS
jgi:hypothetical protein